MTREERDIIIKAQERIRTAIDVYYSIILFGVQRELTEYDKQFIFRLQLSVDELQQVLDNDHC